MFQFEEEAMFVQDREDLIQLIRMRFGNIEPYVIDAIYKLNKIDALERLFLVGANAPDFNTFLEELHSGDESFKLVGEKFNPIQHITEKGEVNGK